MISIFTTGCISVAKLSLSTPFFAAHKLELLHALLAYVLNLQRISCLFSVDYFNRRHGNHKRFWYELKKLTSDVFIFFCLFSVQPRGEPNPNCAESSRDTYFCKLVVLHKFCRFKHWKDRCCKTCLASTSWHKGRLVPLQGKTNAIP